MPVGMIVSYIRFACERKADVSCHIGVGFCVARLDGKGNAKASKIETGNRYRLLRFFVFMSVSGEFSGKQKIMTMRAIIAISAFANRGKTSAITTLAKRFPMRDVEYFNYEGERLDGPDVGKILCRAKCDINGVEKTIGFSSEGDNARLVNQGLSILTDHSAKVLDVMVVACRTQKDSTYAVSNFAKGNGYGLIWTANYFGTDSEDNRTPVLSNGLDLNGIFAEDMVSLIKRLLS